jgi:hypothetical protein
MLKCETNTFVMSDRIMAAAFQFFGPGRFFCSDFEHGHWWITELSNGAQYSVMDASGPGTMDGFSFELVTEGEEA